uniref:SANT domain-containing protein n=1 Tax=Panagrellus redivivus TaxID=6233 RepID=A0A7E4ZZI2_PANRE
MQTTAAISILLTFSSCKLESTQLLLNRLPFSPTMSDPPKTNYLVVVGDDSNQVVGHLQSLYEATSTGGSDIDFRLDTKYYTAKVSLKSFDDLRGLAVWRSNHRDAVVTALCCVMKRTQTTIDLTKLTALLDYFDFDCKIVACYQSSLSQPFGTTLVHWANSYGFEIIDLEPDAADVSYYEEIHEKYGLARVDEVLHAATWVNVSMKPKVEPKPYVDDSDQFDPFEGELDDEDRKAIDSLFQSLNILDYYGLRNTAGPEGEMSILEEEEKQAKKQKKNKKKRQKKDIDQGQESEDVGIELDQSGENLRESGVVEEPKSPADTEAPATTEGDAKKKKKKPKKKKPVEDVQPTSGAVYIDMSGVAAEVDEVQTEKNANVNVPLDVQKVEVADAPKDAKLITKGPSVATTSVTLTVELKKNVPAASEAQSTNAKVNAKVKPAQSQLISDAKLKDATLTSMKSANQTELSSKVAANLDAKKIAESETVGKSTTSPAPTIAASTVEEAKTTVAEATKPDANNSKLTPGKLNAKDDADSGHASPIKAVTGQVVECIASKDHDVVTIPSKDAETDKTPKDGTDPKVEKSTVLLNANDSVDSGVASPEKAVNKDGKLKGKEAEPMNDAFSGTKPVEPSNSTTASKPITANSDDFATATCNKVRETEEPTPTIKNAPGSDVKPAEEVANDDPKLNNAKEADQTETPISSKASTPDSSIFDVNVDGILQNIIGEKFRLSLQEVKRQIQAQPLEKQLELAGKVAEATFRQLSTPTDDE